MLRFVKQKFQRNYFEKSLTGSTLVTVESLYINCTRTVIFREEACFEGGRLTLRGYTYKRLL